MQNPDSPSLRKKERAVGWGVIGVGAGHAVDKVLCVQACCSASLAIAQVLLIHVHPKASYQNVPSKKDFIDDFCLCATALPAPSAINKKLS